MKKYFYLMALVAMAGFVYTSCSEDDDDSTKVTITAGATADDAALYEIEDPSQGYVKEIDGVKYALSKIEFTEDYGAILQFDELATKAAEAYSGSMWGWYKFTKDGDDKFKVLGFGDIIVETAKDQGGYHKRSHITLIPTDVDMIDVYASLVDQNISGELADYLCHTWTISKARILVNDYSYTSDNTRHLRQYASSWISETEGTVHLMDLIDYANNEHNAGLNTDLGERNIVESLVFTGTGTFMINYANTKLCDIGCWSWASQDTSEKSGAFSYIWYNEEMGNDLLGGAATIKFSGNEADLRLAGTDRSGVGSGTGHNSEYTGSDFEVQFKLQLAN
ncbi:MAG: hypothetical protein E7070_11615 [Bacteroidales bacterium]|jgi:hypothetical protein|nr:hypothetical protein [Bacteroidales bacterium]